MTSNQIVKIISFALFDLSVYGHLGDKTFGRQK